MTPKLNYNVVIYYANGQVFDFKSNAECITGAIERELRFVYRDIIVEVMEFDFTPI